MHDHGEDGEDHVESRHSAHVEVIVALTQLTVAHQRERDATITPNRHGSASLWSQIQGTGYRVIYLSLSVCVCVCVSGCVCLKQNTMG